MRRRIGIVAVALAVLAGCGGADDREVRAADGTPPAAEADEGGDAGERSLRETATVRVVIGAEVGRMIHGFDVALRIETGDGEVVRATSWVDFVQEEIGEDANLGDYYETPLEQDVPAGPIVVRAQPIEGHEDGSIDEVDPEGTLGCRVEADLAPGGTVEVVVGFFGDPCLTVVPSGPTETTTTTTTTTAPVETTTSVAAPVDLPVGSQHHVNVDLVCEAFDLAGATWTLLEGDPSTWQPPGERFEGGTFTIDTPTTGTFRGDYEGVKSATFRRLAPDEAPACEPQVRYPEG